MLKHWRMFRAEALRIYIYIYILACAEAHQCSLVSAGAQPLNNLFFVTEPITAGTHAQIQIPGSMASENTFSVPFQMNFGETLQLYVIEGSAVCPDACSLLIPLMRQGLHGTPLRHVQTTDWLFLSYQNIDGVVTQWAGWRFRLLPSPIIMISVYAR